MSYRSFTKLKKILIGIPGHGGKREKAFAKKFSIPVLSVVDNDSTLIDSYQV